MIVHFSIAVQVMQANQLVTAGHEDLSIDQLDAERLEKAGCDAIPLRIERVFVIESLNSPDIAIPSAKVGGFPVWGKVDSRRS